jgi:hypothetical protein
MTVAMSDRDYAVLVEAAGWVRQHSGADAPEYAELGNLGRVVDGIAKRRPRAVDPLRVVENREPRDQADPSALDLRDAQSSRGASQV